MLDRLASNSWFSSLDLKKRCLIDRWKIHPEDKEKNSIFNW